MRIHYKPVVGDAIAPLIEEAKAMSTELDAFIEIYAKQKFPDEENPNLSASMIYSAMAMSIINLADKHLDAGMIPAMLENIAYEYSRNSETRRQDLAAEAQEKGRELTLVYAPMPEALNFMINYYVMLSKLVARMSEPETEH